MLTEQPILITSVNCGAIGGVVKYRFISFAGVYGASGSKSLGVSNADTNQNEMIPVTAKGIAIVQSGDAFSLGRAIQATANGKAIQQDTGPLEGYALDESSAADQLIRILLA